MTEQKKHNIWVVEDDHTFKSSLEDLIEMEDQFELVYSVNSIEKAFEGFATKRAPDVILEDIELPGMSGIEAISYYKKQYPRAAIIMLTIFDDDDRVFEAIKAGADGYLLKRSSGEEIIKAIKDVLNGGAPISPAIAKKMMRMLTGASSDKKESPLTKREQTILKLLVDGYTIDMISGELHISPFTVDTHTKNIYRKLHVHNRSSVVAKAIRDGLV
ncbi:MAG: response regulator transcription factor [Balneolaceae bacterium]|nr:response regulator transcription factor [Balneolaceae bacterium]MBO6546068.1 response regulator transcription factor [Balneolaceae bacterium]MBO6647464.1 response regulator transcription factor [Balneolaceae bacterium]